MLITRLNLILGWILAATICLGILPSFTALSESPWYANSPLHYLGPINFLKISIPLFFLFLALNRKKFPSSFQAGFALILAAGTAASLVSAKLCGAAPSSVLREWAAMLFGALAAVSFVALPSRRRSFVVLGWLLLVYGLIILDFSFPAAIDWLYAHVFDPNTKWYDAETSQTRILTGVFGFQSMGKLLSWLPWIAFIFVPAFWRGRDRWLWLIFTSVSTGLILATTQRGPLLGMAMGWFAFCTHLYFREKDTKAFSIFAAAALISLSCTWLFTPGNIFAARVESVSVVTQGNAPPPAGKEFALAHNNLNFRKLMWGLSLRTVEHHPLGEACIPDSEFTRLGIYSTHSHNLFLHQFRERGWIWGLLHLVLWIGALVLAWRSHHPAAAGLFGGLVCICVQGMFDHPWFVMNHALLLSSFLIASFTVNHRVLFPCEQSA